MRQIALIALLILTGCGTLSNSCPPSPSPSCSIPPVPKYSDSPEALYKAGQQGGLVAYDALLQKGKVERDAYMQKVVAARAACLKK